MLDIVACGIDGGAISTATRSRTVFVLHGPNPRIIKKPVKNRKTVAFGAKAHATDLLQIHALGLFVSEWRISVLIPLDGNQIAIYDRQNTHYA